jgi:hypothetical protein
VTHRKTAKACPWPGKVKHTQREAQERARKLQANKALGLIVAYRCRAGGHYHVGHPPRRR